MSSGGDVLKEGLEGEGELLLAGYIQNLTCC